MVANFKFQYFFTYIRQKPMLQLIGWLTIGLVFFGFISYTQWKQHLNDDKALVISKDDQINRFVRLYENECKKNEKISSDYLDYVIEVKRCNDSIFKDNRDFLKELQKTK